MHNFVAGYFFEQNSNFSKLANLNLIWHYISVNLTSKQPNYDNHSAQKKLRGTVLLQDIYLLNNIQSFKSWPMSKTLFGITFLSNKVSNNQSMMMKIQAVFFAVQIIST